MTTSADDSFDFSKLLVDLCPGTDPIVVAAVKGQIETLRDELAKDRNVDLRDLENGRTLLIWAVENGQKDTVQLLLEHGAGVNKQDLRNWTPLLSAAAIGHGDIAKCLIAAGANIDHRDESGRTPLIIGLQASCDHVVQYLLEAGANVNTKEWRYGRCALSWAAEKGCEKAVKILLQANAEVDLADDLGRTPMSWAAMNGHADVVSLLLQHNASPETKDKEYDRTPFLWAIKYGQKSVIQVLKAVSPPELDYGMIPRPTPPASDKLDHLQELFRTVKPDFDWRKTQGGDILIWTIQENREEDAAFIVGQGAELNVQDDEGMTALSNAAYKGHLSVVQLLLAANIDPDSKDGLGRTPLSYAAEGGHSDIVELLVERDVNLESTDNSDMTPLLWASCAGHEDVVATLLERGADVNAMDVNGYTAMSFAAEDANLRIIRFALEKGGLPDEGMEVSPLMQAVCRKDMIMLKLLLDHGANPYSELYNCCEAPPLVLAASHGKKDLVQIFLGMDAPSAKIKEEHSWRALREAAVEGETQAVEFLLKECNFDEERWKDDSPMFYARICGHQDIVGLLQPYYSERCLHD